MRLDNYLFVHSLAPSRTKSGEMIKSGYVLVNGEKAYKRGKEVSDKDTVEIAQTLKYVSNGGYKLERAVNAFNLDFTGAAAADIGASNGGFTQCLLDNGAEKVYAVDVGECALEEVLRRDERVIVCDRINARELKLSDVGGVPLDLAVIDVSFISLTLVLKAVAAIVKDGGYIVALIKPQFESGKKSHNKNGIVTCGKIISSVVDKIIAYSSGVGLYPSDIVAAPFKARKNREYLIKLVKGKPQNFNYKGLNELI